MDFSEKAFLAERAARAAGDMLEHHGAFQIHRKSENDFVTEMDFKSETLIRDILLTACPEDEFFGEETGGAKQARGRWIVDPIDGTANFMRGDRLYTVSIAYEHEGVLTIGCVFCPSTNELFLAEKGKGATWNGQPIHVTATDIPRNAVARIGFGHRDPACLKRTLAVFPRLISSISDVRRSGTAAYDLCCLAAGRCDAMMELGLGIYDYAAGYVIITEAGGRFSGWSKEEDGLKTGNVFATNGVLHEAIMEMLQE